MTDAPGRPWWRRKRWVAAVALFWLVAAYPLSLGPVAFFGGRGVLDFGEWEELYDPLHNTVGEMAGPLYWGWVDWWYELGRGPGAGTPPASEWHPRR